MERGPIVDAAVLVIVVFAVGRGWRHGSVRELFGLLGLAGGILLAPAFVGPIAALVRALSSLETNVTRLVALIAVIALVELGVVWLGIRKTRDIQIPGPRSLDRAGGVVLAGFRAMTVASLFLYALLAIAASDRALPGFAEGVQASASGDLLADTASPFTGFYDSLLTRSDDLRALTLWVRQQTDLSQTVPADRLRFAGATAGLEPRAQAERKLLRLMNEERQRRGVEPLAWCDRCAEVARLHSKDMYVEGYFSHVDLDGLDPFERMRRANISYAAAGENLAIAPTVLQAHESLLASPDHRHNMLRPTFDEVGIGIFNGPYGLMCTEIFRTSP